MLDEFEIERLTGPPPEWFDCGRDEQNRFLRDRAWPDQQALLSTTYLLTDGNELAAFATVCMSGIALDRRERGPAVRYQDVSALKPRSSVSIGRTRGMGSAATLSASRSTSPGG